MTGDVRKVVAPPQPLLQSPKKTAIIQHPETGGYSEHYAFITNIHSNNRRWIPYGNSATSNHCFVEIKDFTVMEWTFTIIFSFILSFKSYLIYVVSDPLSECLYNQSCDYHMTTTCSLHVLKYICKL